MWRNLCRALATCRYHKLSYSSKNVAVLPFLRQDGKTVCLALPISHKNGYAAEPLSCPADLPISWDFVLYKNCCRFAVFMAKRLTFCRTVPVCSKMGNAAEPSAVLCLLADIMNLKTLHKMSPFCRFAFYRTMLKKHLPRRFICCKILNAAVHSAMLCRLANITRVYTAKIVIVLPFCRFYGHTAKPFTAPCRFAAKTAMRQNSQPCRADLPMFSAFILRNNVIVLPFCRFYGHAAEPFAALCWYNSK